MVADGGLGRLLDREKRGVRAYYRARTETLASLDALIGKPAR
jgi:hypothetical protein